MFAGAFISDEPVEPFTAEGTSPLMMSPNSSHFWPLKRCICNCAIGAKSVAAVLILTPGKQRVRRKVLQARGLLHDVGAGEVVAAHLEHLRQRLGGAVAVDVAEPSSLVGARNVLVDEFDPFLHAGVVVPLRIGRVLGVGRREHALRILEAGRLITLPTEAETLVMICSGFQPSFSRLLDGLRARISAS